MNSAAQLWMRLPAELRELPQWLLAGPNDAGELKVPTTVGLDGRLAPGSHSDASTWLDFDYALASAQEFGLGLGFVISAEDPYCCVDLDIKNAVNKPNNPELWTPAAHVETMRYIAEDLDSYTELSQSGQGVHVWVRAAIGEGVKKYGVEVYSQLRFIACTGKSIHSPAKPIQERQENVAVLVANIRASQEASRAAGLYENDSEVDDDELMRRAWNAENAQKFRDLWEGKWLDLGYPSQSEADLSLMSMLTFYSRNNEQCRRLFRHSKLGQREKATQNDRYLDYTLRLIRGRQAREDKAVEAIRLQAEALMAQRAGTAGPDAAAVAAAAAFVAQTQAAGGLPPPAPQPPRAPPLPPVPEGGLAWPPGRTGDIARFIYNSAPRPVREVAIVAALGWMAGVCGKAWVIPNSGLNLYIILVARSAIGKEAMHSGLGALTYRVRQGAPGASVFVNFNDFASGPALAKACAEFPSFVNVSGEFGRKLETLASNNPSGPMQSLRTIMTHLYQKSGPTSIVGGISYSNKEASTAAISGVAYSMIGETTPDTLYASLTESMMADGFLSRFTIVEYDGLRPPLNPAPIPIPDNDLAQWCAELCIAAGRSIDSHKPNSVYRSNAAGAIMDAFDAECDTQINSTNDESRRQMWNRAHLKVCRIAALLAIGRNLHEPCIEPADVNWAMDLVRRDIAIMQRRLDSGDVGQGDPAREKKLLHIIHEYLSNLNTPLPQSYNIPDQMRRDAVVPWKYLQMRVNSVSSFVKHPYGAKRALTDAVGSLCDGGYIAEMDKVKAGELYTFMGRCFRVVNLPKFS